MIEFIWALAAIILIDIVLGGENALVIAMASRNLPEHLKKKALVWGTLGAVGVRFACVAALTYLLMVPGLRLMAGAALIYIAWMLTQEKEEHEIKTATTFWGAMSTIIVADAVMGVDNALAIAAAANGSWLLIIIGLLISVPIVIFGSTIIMKIIEKYPWFIFLGSFVLYVVAIKMMLHEPFIDRYFDPMDDWAELLIPWLGASVLTAKQYYRQRIRK
jgi:YjbE family integral membrane protein